MAGFGRGASMAPTVGAAIAVTAVAVLGVDRACGRSVVARELHR